MKTKLTLGAVAILATMFAAQLSAEAVNYRAQRTTVQRLSDTASVIVIAELDRVENTNISDEGHDAAKYKSINDGSVQDGEKFIRREGILKINTVLKGDYKTGDELRFVSIRQLKFEAYDDDLRTGEAIWFMYRRAIDDRYEPLVNERGTISPDEVGGDLNVATKFIKDHLAHSSTNEAGIDRMLNHITLDGSRLSVDNCLELSWSHAEYAEAISFEQRQRILDLMKLSPVGSRERNELITAVGRYNPEGALHGLLELMLNDSSWSTTSLGSMSLEYVDRGAAIDALLVEWDKANDVETQTVIVRSLGLIRPKSWHDGEEVRNRTLNLIGGLLEPTTDKGLLREALIASRDMRSTDAHITQLKSLIDNRESNGLGEDEVNAAIIALAAARNVTKVEGAPDEIEIIEEEYLKELGEGDPILKQVIDSALLFPYSALISGADGKGH